MNDQHLATMDAPSAGDRATVTPATASGCRPAAPPPRKRTPPPLPAAASKPSRPPLAEGMLIGGRYRLERRVGVGGMGEVWAAEHVALRMRVAVKLLLLRALAMPEIVVRFEREALLLGRAKGDHLPRVIDYFVDEVYGPVLATEFVEGRSLSEAMKTRLSVEEAVDLGIELATALAELHRASVVHRDLKPSNVILRPTAEDKTSVVIIDLGVSCLVRSPDSPARDDLAAITNAEVVLGTIEYMPPEQILQSAAVTRAADLYAVGAILVRAVQGRHVFGSNLDKAELARAKLTQPAPPLHSGRGDRLARGLAKVVARALERLPADRYQTAEELAADLERVKDEAAREAAQASRPSSHPVARALWDNRATLAVRRALARGMGRSVASAT